MESDHTSHHSPGPLVVPLGVSLLMILDIVHSPHCALHILHPLEALVETEIVSDSVLQNMIVSVYYVISYIYCYCNIYDIY